MEALADIFTGKGGTFRLIIVGLVALGFADLITENNYQLNRIRGNDSISLKAASCSEESTSAQIQAEDNKGELQNITAREETFPEQ